MNNVQNQSLAGHSGEHSHAWTPGGQKSPVAGADLWDWSLQCYRCASSDPAAAEHRLHYVVISTVRLTIFRKYWLSCARIWEVAVCRRSPVGGEAQRREHLEAIHPEKAKEEDPWVQLLPFLPRLRKSDAAGAALLPLGWGDLLVSPQQWRWQDLLSQGGSVSSCVAALAPRCCGTRLRRQLVIKLWREVFWVLTFVRSSLQQLTLSCSFSLRWGALHLGTCFSPSAVIREAAADAITELAASRAWARRVPWES